MDGWEREIARFARRHYGLFTVDLLRRLDVTEKQLRRRLALGRWERVQRGVYRIAGTPETWEATLLGACWTSPGRVAASHRSALALCELPGGRRVVCEVISPRWHRGQHHRIVAHESLQLPAHHLTFVGVIPTTTPTRTLIDSAAVLHRSVLVEAVDEALRRELTSPVELLEMLEELGVNGRRGARMLKSIVQARATRDAATESPMEDRLLALLTRSGLPAPVPQHEVRLPNGIIRLDFAYPAHRIGIEFDSYLHHGRREKFVRDLARRNDLTAAGWTMLHVTAGDLTGTGQAICETVRHVLDVARRPPEVA